MHRLQKYWVGLVFLGMGVLFLAAELNWIPVQFQVQHIWSYIWPVLIIIGGGSWLLGQLGSRLGWFSLILAGMVTSYGVLQLLVLLGLTTFRPIEIFARGWPLFILAIGLEMLFGGRPAVRVFRGRRSSRAKSYVGRMHRDNGGWNVRWEDVDAPEADNVVLDAVANSATDNDDAATPDETGAPGADGAKPNRDRKTDRGAGFRNETRVAGDLRIGTRPWVLKPDTVFNLGAGEMEIDLSTAEISPGENRLTVQQWAGQVNIYVPDDLAIAVETKLTAGQICIFDEDHDGLGPSVHYRSVDYDQAERKVHIRVEMMFGQVNVKEAY